MGCFISRDIHPRDKLENYSSKKGWTHVKSRKDIKVPLSEKEILSISKTWKTISKNIIDTGISMFLRMFEESSEVRNMFEQFRTVDNLSELWTSRALENHALLVMNALDETMANLDDHVYIVDMLITTGKSHRRFEHFGAHIFWAIEEPFIESVKQTLGEKCTTKMENIYRKAISFVLNTLILGFKNEVD